jgi:hypothetical protein
MPEPDRSKVLLTRCLDIRPYNERLIDHLVSYAGRDERIHVIDANQTHFPLHEFFACLNVFLAVFRSEGYGPNLVEAAQVGPEFAKSSAN